MEIKGAHLVSAFTAHWMRSARIPTFRACWFFTLLSWSRVSLRHHFLCSSSYPASKQFSLKTKKEGSGCCSLTGKLSASLKMKATMSAWLAAQPLQPPAPNWARSSISGNPKEWRMCLFASLFWSLSLGTLGSNFVPLWRHFTKLFSVSIVRAAISAPLSPRMSRSWISWWDGAFCLKRTYIKKACSWTQRGRAVHSLPFCTCCRRGGVLQISRTTKFSSMQQERHSPSWLLHQCGTGNGSI